MCNKKDIQKQFGWEDDDAVDKIDKNPIFPESSQHSSSLYFLCRWKVNIPRAVDLLFRWTLQLFKEKKKNFVRTNSCDCTANMQSPWLHALMRDYPQRSEALKHNIPQCTFSFSLGTAQDLWFRLVDQLKSNALDLLRNPTLRISWAAQKKELQQQDRCVGVGCPRIWAAIRSCAIWNSFREGFHKNSTKYSTQIEDELKFSKALNISEEAKEFISICLCKDPRDRYTVP